MTSPDNKPKLIYVCSPLSAPTRAETLANAAKAAAYMVRAENEFGGRSVAPHAYLPYLLDDSVPEQRALAIISFFACARFWSFSGLIFHPECRTKSLSHGLWGFPSNTGRISKGIVTNE